jgi:hypothetical protein
LYLLEPQGFAVNGAHLEPAINEEALRRGAGSGGG